MDLFEISAESVPLSPQSLQKALEAAASSTQQQINAGTRQLQAWECKEGYYSLLQDVSIQTSQPLHLRLLAVTLLKNGIDKYWRKSAINAIRSDERDFIRSRLLQSGISAEISRLTSINAIVIGKIARIDFPEQWPTLFVEIIGFIKAATTTALRLKQLMGILQITLQVVKELMSARLQRSRYNLLTVTPELFAVLRGAYHLTSQEWQRTLSSNLNFQTIEQMRSSELILKVIRRSVVAGYDFPHRDNDVQDFWKVSGAHMRVYMQFFHHKTFAADYKTLAGRHLIQIAKFHFNMAAVHPISFPLLSDTFALVHGYWEFAKAMRNSQRLLHDEISEVEFVYEAFNLRALLLLRLCFKMVHSATHPFKYKSSPYKDDPARAKELVKTRLLTNVFVKELCEVLINRFFIFVPSDIEEWTAEPEEWEMKEEVDENDYELSVRPCAERLFLDIVLNYKELVIQPVIDLFTQVSSAQNNDIFFKDAAYCAIGVAAPILNTKFDFNAFLTTSLIAELQQQQSNHHIIRRRIAILLAQWAVVNIAQANRPLVYQIFEHLLDKAVPWNDQAVRITAGKRFKDIADDMYFQAELFTPYAPRIMAQIVDLIQEVAQSDTKLALLHTLSAVIERMENQITPLASQIVTLLPPLWNGTGKDHLMKQAIVAILTNLVNAMKADSVPIHGMILPFIKGAVDPRSETQLYLLDDALELWLAIVSQTRLPSAELLSLVTSLFPIFELELDSVKQALQIMQAYILLSPVHMLYDDMRDKLLRTLAPLLVIRKPDIIDLVTENLELIIRAADSIGGEQAVGVLTFGLSNSTLLQTMFTCILRNWESLQTTGPNAKDPPPDWKNETNYFVVLARLIMGSTQSFISSMQTTHLTMKQLLTEWFRHMDEVTDPTETKLMCLALTKLLETGQPWIVGVLQDLMALWTCVIAELRDGDDTTGDSLIYKSPNTSASNGKGSPEDERRRLLTFADPIHTVDLGQYVKHCLSKAVKICGGDEKFRKDWLVHVDKEVLDAFAELGVM